MFNLSEVQKAELVQKIVDFIVTNLPALFIFIGFFNIHFFYLVKTNCYQNIFVAISTFCSFIIFKNLFLSNFTKKMEINYFKKIITQKSIGKNGFLSNVFDLHSSHLIFAGLYLIFNIQILFFINLLFFIYTIFIAILFSKKIKFENKTQPKKD